MNPNEVKEVIDNLINELGLPIVAYNSGPQLVSDNAFRETQDGMDNVIKQWMNGCGKSHSISVGRTTSNMEDAITCLALETHRAPEIKEILKALITERTLPLEVVDREYKLQVIANEGIIYRDEDMNQLKLLLKKEGLDVEVRHNGFDLYSQKDGYELQYSDVETLANRLASSIKEYGLQVRLLHHGFSVEKDKDVEVDIAEVEEITMRLEIMVGIRFVQGGYTYSDNVQNKKVHWHSAHVNTALPLI